MKYLVILLLFFSMQNIFAQEAGVLHLSNNKLIGDCENRYFTGFEIELDSIYSSIDSATLFDQLPRMGTISFRNRIDMPTEFMITERAGYPQIMFRFKTSYHTFDDLKILPNLISFKVDEDPDVPPTETDLRIVRMAKELLSKEVNWHKSDDRVCDDDLVKGTYSLYCALRVSSLEIEGRYNHRNASLQKLRHLIATKFPGRKWQHRLMDFNNMEETSYRDVVNILEEIEKSFVRDLK